MVQWIEIALTAMLAAQSEAPVTIEAARRFFGAHQEQLRAFDHRVADAYCDEGTIRLYREGADGLVRPVFGPAPPWKRILRESMAEAKRQNDYSEFSKITLHEEGDVIRIESTRYSVLRKYESPSTHRVGRCRNGQIGILEMTFRTKHHPE